MKEYEKPSIKVVLLGEQDICTTSGGANNVDGSSNASFGNYDFGGPWL